jgi:indolepyruvate ferredoxin oxidoreductase beta subunit
MNPPSQDPLNIIITGVGGQGNVLASQIIGRAAVYEGWKVTVGETFGLSQRGGPVMSHIRLSPESNYAPLIPPNQAHIIISLEPLESLRILLDYGNEGTVSIVNSRSIHPSNVIAGDVEYPDLEKIKSILTESGSRLYWLEATEKAMELGAPILLNMILLGALGALSEFPLSQDTFRRVVSELFIETKKEVNYQALEAGADMIKHYED